MHYRNGRAAKNGDRIVMLDYDQGLIVAVGTLRDAVPGNDYCNGYVQAGPLPSVNDPIACMCDCLHADDVAELFAVKGWNKRPKGK